MKRIFFLILIVALASCGKQTRLEKLFNEADVVKVYIYGGGPIPVVHYETNNIDKIKDWSKYISNKDAATSDCKFEGKLIFKVYEDSTQMSFSLRPGCRYVHFTAADSTFNKELTPDGIAFLQGLMKAQ